MKRVLAYARRVSMTLAFCTLGATTGPVLAQDESSFIDPILLTDGAGSTVQAAMASDARNVHVLSVGEPGGLSLKTFGVGVSVERDLSVEGLVQGDPSLSATSFGTVFVAYAQEDPSPAASGRDTFLLETGFNSPPPANLSSNLADDYAPQVALDRFGDPHVVWTRELNGVPNVVVHNPVVSQIVVRPGESPSIAVARDGTDHLVYVRDRDVFYVAGLGGPTDEIPLTNSPAVGESQPGVAVTLTGDVIVAYESRGSLFLMHKPVDSTFGEPEEIVTGGVADLSRPRVRSDGRLSFAFTRNGDVFYVLTDDLDDMIPVRVTSTSEATESQPSVGVDINGDVHVAYLRDGDVYYTNNAVTPTANFDATPRSGEAPMEVEFEDLSLGRIQEWRWHFGDGATSTQQNPTHLYEQAGSYTVTLEVVGPGGRDDRIAVEFINLIEPQSLMWIPDLLVHPDLEEVWVPVKGTFVDPIQGFSIAGTFDPNALELLEITLAHSYPKTVNPKIFQTDILNDEGLFAAGALIDFPEAPGGNLESRTLRPDSNRRIVNLVFRILEADPLGGGSLDVQLAQGVGESEVNCSYVVDAKTKIAAITSGAIRFIDPLNSPGIFIRGDVNFDAETDLTDSINLLSHLFLGNYNLRCPDAADFNDDGALDVSDPIGILSFLFLGARTAEPPFPSPGSDATEDTLDPCR